MNDRAFVARLVLSVAVATAVMLTGCAAIQRSETRPTEHLLTAAGFELRPSRVRQKNSFPGYIFVEMDLNEETWHLVKDTSKIMGFVGGPGGKDPIEVKASQIDGDIWGGPWR